MATFHTLPAVTRRTQVAEALRSAIMTGELLPGAKITELDLAAKFGVSRGPIREAIRELINEGLLMSRPYSGTYVSLIEEKTITEAYGLRKAIEGYAFKLCWPHRDSSYRKTIESRHSALLRALSKRRIGIDIRAEIDLHSVPYEYAHNDMLLETWRQLARKIQLGFLVYRLAGGDSEFSHAHDRYVELALGSDLNAMLTEVDRHIDLGLQTVHAFFRERHKRKPRQRS